MNFFCQQSHAKTRFVSLGQASLNCFGNHTSCRNVVFLAKYLLANGQLLVNYFHWRTNCIHARMSDL